MARCTLLAGAHVKKQNNAARPLQNYLETKYACFLLIYHRRLSLPRSRKEEDTPARARRNNIFT